MNTAKHYLLWPLLVAGLIAQGQTRKLDSLRSTLHQTTDKQERLQLLLALGNEQHSLNRDTAYQYAAEATALDRTTSPDSAPVRQAWRRSADTSLTT